MITDIVSNKVLPPSAQVNRVGKYLYKQLDGAFKYETSSNTCDVYFIMLYEVPYLYKIPGKQKEGYNDVHEMIVNLNITTYQNKLRVNIIEVTPQARTLGFDLYDAEQLEDLEQLKSTIWKNTVRRITKAYKGYDFVF